MPRSNRIIEREIRTIRSSFRQIARSFGRIAPLLTGAAAPPSGASGSESKSRRRRPRLSADQRRALKLQGKYMGTMRGLRPAERAKVKKIRATKGIRAAIAEAQKLAS